MEKWKGGGRERVKDFFCNSVSAAGRNSVVMNMAPYG
jgi:hypothetical protein